MVFVLYALGWQATPQWRCLRWGYSSICLSYRLIRLCANGPFKILLFLIPLGRRVGGSVIQVIKKIWPYLCRAEWFLNLFPNQEWVTSYQESLNTFTLPTFGCYKIRLPVTQVRPNTWITSHGYKLVFFKIIIQDLVHIGCLEGLK
jgi:hypothetical protein